MRRALPMLALLCACNAILPLSAPPGSDATVPPDQHAGEGIVTTDVQLPRDGRADAGVVQTRVFTGEVAMDAVSRRVSLPGLSPDHAFVICSYRADGSEAYFAPTCQLDGSDVVIATGDAAATTIVRYQVVQTPRARVQRGQVQLGANETQRTDVALGDPVVEERSFVLVTGRTSQDSSSLDQLRVVLAQLEDSRTLGLYRSETGTAADIEWQVVELQGATVQSKTSSIPATDTSVSATMDKVEPAHSFLVFSTLAETTAKGMEDAYAVRGRIDGSQSLVFERGKPGAKVDVRWFVVQFPDATVQHSYNSDLMPGVLVADQYLNPPVPPERSFPLCSCYLADVGEEVHSLLDALATTAHLVPGSGGPADTVQFERGDDEQYDIGCAWQVVTLVSP